MKTATKTKQQQSSRAKTLKPKDRVAAKQSEEARALEKKREAKRAASKRYYQNKKRRLDAAERATPEQVQSLAADKPIPRHTITKSQLIAALEVHVAAARSAQTVNVARVEALETAIGLARLLG